MVILHIINSLEIGGAQKLVGDILLYSRRHQNIEVKVIVFKTTESEIEREIKGIGIDLISLDCKILSFKAITRLIALMRKADIVHAHLFPTNYAVAFASHFSSAIPIFTEHSTHNRRRNHKWLKPLEKFVYKRFKKIICISEATSNALEQWIGSKIAIPRIEIIENGIDLNLYKKSVAKNTKDIFGREGIPLLMISRFSDSKDHPTVLRALTLIDNNEVFVAFAGTGAKLDEIKKYATELKVEDKVKFLGNRSDIPVLIKSSFLGIQSSNWEGFGLTAVEMMAGGIPVIASDVEGLRQIVNGYGILFPQGDYKALAGIVNKLLIDENLRNTTIEKCSLRAESYSIEKTVNNHIILYRKIYH